MFAIVEILGKQYKVTEGEILQIDKIEKKKDEKIVFDNVLLFEKDGSIEIGKPKLDIKVEGTIIEHKKDKKVIVFKHKPKKRYHRTYGHRQQYSFVKIEKISA